MEGSNLVVEHLFAGYTDVDIVHGVSVRVEPGQLVAVIGPNGAGKSTLLKSIMGLVPPRSGTVRLGDRDLAGLPTHRIVASGITYVPQVSNVFPNLTVDENLDVGGFLRPSGLETARQRVRTLFPLLAERAHERVGRLSGGQRQMVAIGRALMLEPRVLLLDEPSAGLAPQLREQLFAQIRAVRDAGLAVLIVEQNAKMALRSCDRGYVLEQGKNRYEGSGAELLEDPKVGRLYLGEAQPS